MSYEYNECVCCYLQGQGNSATIRTICSVCIEGWKCDCSKSVSDECMKHPGDGGTCITCHRNKMFMFNVGLCDDCLTKHRKLENWTITFNNCFYIIKEKEDIKHCLRTGGYRPEWN